MTRIRTLLLLLLAALLQTAFAAQRGKAALDMQQGRGALATSGVRPFAASAEARADMARYSLKAYENRDQTNAVKGLHHLPSSRREVIAAFVPTALLLLAILGWHAGNPSTDGLLISECCRRLLTDR